MEEIMLSEETEPSIGSEGMAGPSASGVELLSQATSRRRDAPTASVKKEAPGFIRTHPMADKGRFLLILKTNRESIGSDSGEAPMIQRNFHSRNQVICGEGDGSNVMKPAPHSNK
jgi:hypothetical protein